MKRRMRSSQVPPVPRLTWIPNLFRHLVFSIQIMSPKLTEKAKTKEKQGSNDDLPDEEDVASDDEFTARGKRKKSLHKPQRVLRTVISSMKCSQEFGEQMAREAKRRRFDEATRKAYVADGLTCNWSIHEKALPQLRSDPRLHSRGELLVYCFGGLLWKR